MKSFESRTKESSASTQGLPATFHGLEKGKQRTYWEGFCAKLDAIPADDRLAMLEAFMGNATASDEEIARVIPRLSEEERLYLALYLVDVLRPETYVRTFHACWPSLPWAVQKELLNRFTVDEKEHAILVAPFTDITRVPPLLENEMDEQRYRRRAALQEKYIPDWLKRLSYSKGFAQEVVSNMVGKLGEEEKALHPEPTAPIEHHYNQFESAKRLLEVCLESNPKGCRSLYDRYWQTNPDFLLPYMPRLIREGVCAKEDLEKLLARIGDRYVFDEKFYTTAEEQRRAKELTAYVEKQDKEPIPFDHGFFDDIKKTSLRWIALEQKHINTEARKRGMDHFTSTISEFDGLVSPQAWDKLLQKLLNNGVPVFYMLHRFPLNQKQAGVFMNHAIEMGDAWFRLSDLEDLRGAILACGEDRITSLVSQMLRECMDGDSFSASFMSRLKMVLAWFSEKNQKRILGVINQYHPLAWLRQFDYALENRTISLPKLRAQAEENPPLFLGQFDRLTHYARKTSETEAQANAEIGKLKETARACVLGFPINFFRFPALMSSLFDDGERASFAADHLTVEKPNAAFLHTLLDEPAYHAVRQEHGDLLRHAATRDPETFCLLMEEQRHSNSLIHLLGDRAFEKTFLAYLDRLDFEHLVSSTGKGLSMWLMRDLKRLERVIRALREGDKDVSKLTKLIEMGSEIIHHFRYRIEDETRKKKEGKQDLKSKRIRGVPLVSENQKNFTQCQQAVDLLQRELRHRLSENPDLCFQEWVWSIKNIPDPFIPWKKLDARLEERPEDFFWISSRLSAEQKHAYIKKYGRALAFGSRKGGEWTFKEDGLDPEDFTYLLELNPTLYAKKEVTEDYYALNVRKLRARPYFRLYQDRLEALAADELDRNGVQTPYCAWSPNPEFEWLARRVAILASSPIAVRQEAFLSARPEPERTQLLELLEILSSYQRDAALSDKGLLSPQAEAYLTSNVRDFMFEQMGLSDTLGKGSETLNLTLPALRAFLAYTRKACRPSKDMTRLLQEVFRQAMDGRYEDWRAWGKPRPPSEEGRREALEKMKERSLLPSALDLQTYERWEESEALDLEEVLDVSVKDVTGGIRSILGQAVADHHIESGTFEESPEGITEKYERIYTPLGIFNDRIGELRTLLGGGKKRQEGRPEQEEFDRLTEEFRVYREAHQEELDRLKALSYLQRFRVLTHKELEERTLSLEKTKVPFPQAFKMIEKAFVHTPEFQTDIQRLKQFLQDAHGKIFGGERITRSKLHVTDQVDINVHIRIGEIPVPSCQHYESKGSYNRGLLSYISDPAVKIIQLYDERGRLITRAVLRLLEDGEGKPQLFLERIYTSNMHQKIREAVVRFARRKAQSMGVKLYSHHAESDELVIESGGSRTLHSRGSRNTYIYTDAGGGLCPDGVFTIERAFQVG